MSPQIKVGLAIVVIEGEDVKTASIQKTSFVKYLHFLCIGVLYIWIGFGLLSFSLSLSFRDTPENVYSLRLSPVYLSTDWTCTLRSESHFGIIFMILESCSSVRVF